MTCAEPFGFVDEPNARVLFGNRLTDRAHGGGAAIAQQDPFAIPDALRPDRPNGDAQALVALIDRAPDTGIGRTRAHPAI